MNAQALPVVTVLLAGGRATRMGGVEKCFLRLGCDTLLARQIRVLSPQGRHLVLSANGDPERFRAYDLPILADPVSDDGNRDFAGPLAGLLAAMDWTGKNRARIGKDVEWIVTVPTDLPFVPADLIKRLYDTVHAENVPAACAASGGQAHFATAIWALTSHDRLRETLARGSRKTEDFFRLQAHAIVEWPIDRSVKPPFDPFFNINTPADFAAAQAMAAQR